MEALPANHTPDEADAQAMWDSLNQWIAQQPVLPFLLADVLCLRLADLLASEIVFLGPASATQYFDSICSLLRERTEKAVERLEIRLAMGEEGAET
jgi:hypothetical protein